MLLSMTRKSCENLQHKLCANRTPWAKANSDLFHGHAETAIGIFAMKVQKEESHPKFK